MFLHNGHNWQIAQSPRSPHLSLCNIVVSTLQAMTWPSLSVPRTITSGEEHTSPEAWSSDTKKTYLLVVQTLGLVNMALVLKNESLGHTLHTLHSCLIKKSWNVIHKSGRHLHSFDVSWSELRFGVDKRGIINKRAMTIMHQVTGSKSGLWPTYTYTVTPGRSCQWVVTMSGCLWPGRVMTIVSSDVCGDMWPCEPPVPHYTLSMSLSCPQWYWTSLVLPS